MTSVVYSGCVEEAKFNQNTNSFFISLVRELYAVEVFKGVLLSAFTKNETNSAPIIITDIVLYRHAVVPFLTWLKLSSHLLYISALDIAVVDDLSAEFRFTVRYIVQSALNNNTLVITTKTNETLALSSVQEIYPGFN
jgi:NADH:ubiquinone oxidoreductase subunit C